MTSDAKKCLFQMAATRSLASTPGWPRSPSGPAECSAGNITPTVISVSLYFTKPNKTDIAFWYLNLTAADEKATILAGMDQMSRRTCLKFVERTNETAYVSIKSDADGGCWSEIGFSGQKQELNLGSGCVYVVNELFWISIVQIISFL